jgi:hypothetical protein
MGIPAGEFWEMTMWEFNACLEGYTQRKRSEIYNLLAAACVVANRIPNFSDQPLQLLTPDRLLGLEPEYREIESLDDLE